MITQTECEFIESLPKKYREKASKIIGKRADEWLVMTGNFSNALAAKDELECILKNTYVKRLERVSLQILNGGIIAMGNQMFKNEDDRNDFYLGCVITSINLAKVFIKEIDNV